jgi:glycerol kinase
LGSGVWSSLEELREVNPAARRFGPNKDRSAEFDRWQKAVEITRKF